MIILFFSRDGDLDLVLIKRRLAGDSAFLSVDLRFLRLNFVVFLGLMKELSCYWLFSVPKVSMMSAFYRLMSKEEDLIWTIDSFVTGFSGESSSSFSIKWLPSPKIWNEPGRFSSPMIMTFSDSCCS